MDGLRSDPAGRLAALRRIRRTPEGNRSILGAVGCVLVWGRAGAGAEQERYSFGEANMATILELSSSSCAISLWSCYGFAGLRLHPLLVCDLPPIELDLSQLEVDDGSPVQQLLRRRLRLRQAAAEPGQRGVVVRLAD